MKNKLIFILFFLFFVSALNLTKIYAESSLIVKCKNDSTDLKCIEEIVGEYQFQKLIDPRLIQMTARKPQNSLQSLQIQNKYAQSLSRIYLINYKSNYPLHKLIRYLNTLPNIEYAEIVPERHLCFLPNDSLFNQQYYINTIHATEAWDSLDTQDTVIIGIVDTGIDYRHDDLMNNIYTNPGEIGLDSLGQDKRNNGIDDDGNGFIDDWHGWDFLSDSLGQDNDPIQGNPHGTHLAGIAGAVVNNFQGIAGTAINVKILPVKIAWDNPLSSTIGLGVGFDGIIYSAKMGASVINCSWGGYSYSSTEKETIDYVNSLGATVVAAAGNSNRDELFYPAAYTNVISVAATNSEDLKASFSNYNYSVDVSAPGLEILSTMPWNSYGIMSGTSMASPIAAAVAAMIKNKHPEYTPSQVAEHLIVTCDNIDSLNQSYIGKLGSGRVNAYKAVTIQNPKSVKINEYYLSSNSSKKFNTPSNYGVIILEGDTCKLGIEIENVLSDIKNLNITINSASSKNIIFNNPQAYIGDLNTGTKLKLKDLFTFILPEVLPWNERIELVMDFYEDDSLIRKGFYSFYVHPTYLPIGTEIIGATFNSKGNIGFNDYPKNEQGHGFWYKKSNNLLYEGSLMVASGSQRLSNVARGEDQDYQDSDFYMTKPIEMDVDLFWVIASDSNNSYGYNVGETEFQDSVKDEQAGIAVKQNITVAYQDVDNAIMIDYDIINKRDIIQDSIYVGLYFDWDIGPSGMGNYTNWDSKNNLAFIRNIQTDTLPIIAVKMASDIPVNFWAIDNDGTSDDNPGVWDGFTRDEKIRMLQNGIGRAVSRITDVSTVIGAGPIFLNKNDTVRVKFIIYADTTIENIINADNQLKEWDYIFPLNPNDDNITAKFDSSIIVRNIFPNPIQSNSILSGHIVLRNNSLVKITLYDYLGRKVAYLFNGELTKGEKLLHLYIENIAVGSYQLIIETAEGKKQINLMIME
ncbi:MAG TPA: S8 family peptidase [Candidatus Kapabacteria bacterium]|nr:S8 family peptidase [Candidatus Kapabacteria bacterium]